MHIILVNDDGVHAGGLLALAAALGRDNRVTVVAPDRERSATSHSITLDRPLTVREVVHEDMPDTLFYSVNGTPVDCVHMAQALCGGQADLFVSGINNGANLGGDISYSGTVHAALEASALGYPAIALSLRIAPHAQRTNEIARFRTAAAFSAQIIRTMPLRDLDGIIWNINFPADVEACPPEIRVCPQGKSVYDSVFEKQADPFGREVYWLLAKENSSGYNETHKTDVYWSNAGYATATPLTWNATVFSSMESAQVSFSQIRLHGGEKDAGRGA